MNVHISWKSVPTRSRAGAALALLSLNPVTIPARAATIVTPQTTTATPTLTFPKGRPTWRPGNGQLILSAGLLFQADFGGFTGSGPREGERAGNFPALLGNARRARFMISAQYRNWRLNVTPDFGSVTTQDTPSLYEANLNYTGFRHTVLTLGYFQPRMTEENAETSSSFELPERPAIADLVRNLAGGIGRLSLGGTRAEKRWIVSAYLTGPRAADTPHMSNGSHGGAVFRAAGRPVATQNTDVLLGLGFTDAFRMNRQTGKNYSLSATPEVALGESALISAAFRDVKEIRAIGPQAAFRFRKFLLKGEYYHVDVLHRADAPTSRRNGFDGWYLAGNYTLIGGGRRYNETKGAFVPAIVPAGKGILHGGPGAVELTLRYSELSLNDAASGIHGGRQKVWGTGINWVPEEHFRLMLTYLHIQSTPGAAAWNLSGRTAHAVTGRIQITY